jgi:hypothetical protein
MAEVLAVRATITKIVAGYSVGMVIWVCERSRHLVGKTAVSLSEAGPEVLAQLVGYDFPLGKLARRMTCQQCGEKRVRESG